MNKVIKPVYKAAAYERLSVILGNEEESGSITNQKSFIKKWADDNEIEIYDYYVDDGYSGGNFERPGFKRLINDIKKGVVNCVITKDMSRLGRDFIETSNYIYKFFPENNIRYISILDNFDTENPNTSDDIIPFKTVINDMYLKDTSRKIKSVRHDLMNKGLFVGSTVPYGYKRSKEDNRKLVIDAYAANIVKYIFELKISGMKDLMIARRLTNEGVLPPNVYAQKNIAKTFTTNLWKSSSIKTILGNEVYIGTLIQGKFERVSLKSKKKKLLPKSDWIIKKNNHDKIISTYIFDNVNNKNKADIFDDTRTKKYEYLLKGLVICAECNKIMLVRRCKSSSKVNDNCIYTIFCCRTYATYRNNICSMHYYREEKLNNLVTKEIIRIFAEFACEEKLCMKYDEFIFHSNLLTKLKNNLSTIQKSLINIDTAISNLYTDKINQVILPEEFVILKTKLVKEQKAKKEEIKELNLKISNLVEKSKQKRIKEQIINDFLNVKNFNKQIIKILIKKITIDDSKKVSIYFKFNVNGIVL